MARSACWLNLPLSLGVLIAQGVHGVDKGTLQIKRQVSYHLNRVTFSPLPLSTAPSPFVKIRVHSWSISIPPSPPNLPPARKTPTPPSPFPISPLPHTPINNQNSSIINHQSPPNLPPAVGGQIKGRPDQGTGQLSPRANAHPTTTRAISSCFLPLTLASLASLARVYSPAPKWVRAKDAKLAKGQIKGQVSYRPFGSTIPGNPSEPNPNGFNQRPLWKAPEIQLDDGSDSGPRIQRREGLWHPACDPIRKIAAKNKIILLKRSGELGSRRMQITLKSTDSAKFSQVGLWRTLLISEFQNFRFTQIPLFPRNPLFPASGPATSAFNGLHPKSNCLAI